MAMNDQSFSSLATMETSVSTVHDPLDMLAPSEAGQSPQQPGSDGGEQNSSPAAVISRDHYGNRKYEDDLDDGPEWEWPSDDEEYAEKVADLADRTRDDAIPLLLDKVVREQSMFEHSDVGGWSAADHQSKKREAAALPIKWDKTYEVTNLPLDEWG